MNGYFDRLYNVAGYDEGAALEKTAQIQLLTKIAEEAGVDLEDVDLDALDQEELQELLAEYAEAEEGEEGQEGQEANLEGEGEEVEKEAMAKLAEADLYGRTMAHAFHDEMQKIAATLQGQG